MESPRRTYGNTVHEESTPVKYGERSVTKLVQVPVTREVRVPASIERVVESREVREIPVSKVREEKMIREVQEDYVDYEERPATRMKEVWVKKEVPETYVERVPVPKTRVVQVPYTTTREYTEMQRVEVPVTKVVHEPGYRTDHVVELETHEVVGKQKVEWIPHVVDEWAEERDLGVRDRRVVERREGQVVYPEHGHTDSHYHTYSTLPAGHSHSTSHAGPTHSTHHVGPTFGRSHSEQGSVARIPSPTRQLYNNSVLSETPKSPGMFAQWDTLGDNHFGVYVKETVLGLVVKAVAPGSPASAAGIQPGDILLTVDSLEVYSLDEWRRSIGRKHAINLGYRSKHQGRSMKVRLTQ